MRWILPVVLVAACGFEAPIGGGSAGDDTIVDDDFEGGTTIDSTVEPFGAIEPAVHAYGGLRMDAYNAPLVMPSNTVSWEQLETQLAARKPTGSRLAASIDVVYGERPYGVGLATDNNFTLVFRGEIYLEGPTALTLEGDGPSMVQLAVADGVTYDVRIYDEVSTSNPTMTVTPPKPGWYPIRAAMTDTVGDAVIKLTSAGAALPRERLRSRVTTTGLVVEGFESPALTTTAGLGLADHDLRQTYEATPYDIKLVTDDFALRYAGQLRIDVAGGYRFDATPDTGDGYRVWIDGKVVASAWGDGDVAHGSPVLELAAGWHDLVVDYADTGGAANVNVVMLEGPAGVPLGTIAKERLRPVVRFGTVETFVSTQTSSIPDNGKVTIAIGATTLPGDAIVQSADISYVLTHAMVEQVSTRLLHPDGSADPLRAAGLPARPVDFFGARTAFANKSAIGSGTWRLEVSDGANGQTGVVGSIAFALGYRAGVGPYAPVSTFTSQPRAIEATAIVAARATGTFPPGSSAAVSVRTCPDAPSCDAAPWQAADALPLANAGFVQYRVELASDGWAAPSVDKVEIEIRE